ncbi:disease resistance protein RUN1-like isoform X1 [Prosopis cineraria]|uniref:disease resistance protein RUN1-like isoform X1 n=1 Tax=Prosopis cineraria TaxID=364024 RepID=UPI00240FAE62|nr:disease resistance protein RUN1-like isoform X1 [Prosopis cineraria]XP_054799135.1 disease resistance protein RUN1-like isoform X1 [Prosopis cineraria]
MGGRVFPIFYDVDPADVRNQRKRFGEALSEHERFRGNMDKVTNWRNSLSDIGNLSGWDTRLRPEALLIDEVVGAVWTYLCSKLPSYDDNLVGIGRRMVDLMSCLEIGLDDIRFVGIWGMGGSGKTTLARVVYEEISGRFEMCSFLANVRKTLQKEGPVSLQKSLLFDLGLKTKIHDDYAGMKMIRKLVCNKKVLLVLDDLDNMSPLEKLVESPNGFGKGSRIIITARDKHVLTSCGEKIYEIKIMEKHESLQLFSKKAFKKDHPEEDYLELSESVVACAGGLPLALEVLGSYFRGRPKDDWTDALDKLKQTPKNDILRQLRISFDGLDEKEKTIFLDIACFFRGRRKDDVTQVLKGCDLNPKTGIKALIEKALLVETEHPSLGYPTLEMHDLLGQLGRDIIQQESPNIGKRSRLWELEDIKEVLENKKGSEAIEAIVMQDYYFKPGKINVHLKAFSKMSNIRLLIISWNTDILVLPKKLKLSHVQCLIGAAKVVQWPSFPFETLPLRLGKLAHIEMCHSKIKQLWDGIQFMKKLKYINLSNSQDLTKTPDFSGVPYLEHLILQGCKFLEEVDPSLGDLKLLITVNLSFCENLICLPAKMETNSLEKLDLRCCTKVPALPEFGEGMKNLKYLDVRNTAITAFPKFLGSLTGLEYFNFTRS